MKSLQYWIDDLLAKLTMYHVVVQGLVLLCIASLVLMMTGYLSYSPAAFVISIIIFAGGSYAANRLFGWLFGVKPHGESAVITGLILALLFTPPVSVIAGVKLLLVAVIAMASKYILAFRGKHLFNPAAIAIVIASIGELAFASWWVATPALLPFALISAALILYKTQKVKMGLLFLVVAIPLILIQTAVAGPLNSSTILAAVTSWPLVFFTGVMLSEPQTLPPRRKQQYIVAVAVAILMVIPFHYSSIVMTPALALVLGNALAFSFGIRRGVSLRLVNKKQIGSNGYELTFDTKPLNFEPGQYVELTLPHKGMDMRGMRRVFTIIGRPNDEQLSVATRLPEKSSSFKKALVHLKVGKTIHGTRIAGDFVLPENLDTPIVFVAGGIGITPLLSFLLSSKKRNITLLYAVSSIQDMMFVDELKRFDIKVVVIAPGSDNLPDSSWHLETGRLNFDILQKHIDAANDPTVYISGPPHMVDQSKEWAKQLGVKTIRTDHFTGY